MMETKTELCKHCLKEIFIKGQANIAGICDCTTCRSHWRHVSTGLVMCERHDAEPLLVEDFI